MRNQYEKFEEKKKYWEKYVLKAKCTMRTGLENCELKNVPLNFWSGNQMKHTYMQRQNSFLFHAIWMEVCEFWTDSYSTNNNNNNNNVLIFRSTFN